MHGLLTTCPTDATLAALLRGDLAGPEAGAVRAHAGACDGCLKALDRLSDDLELAAWLAEGLGDEGVVSVLRSAFGGPRHDSVAATLRCQLDVPPPASVGPYLIEAEVGRGGMGVVYRARESTTGRVVALKVLRRNPGDADGRTRARFVREARAASAVEHDHVVRVYGTSGPDDAVLYLAMEFVAGPSLAGRLRDRGQLEPRQAAEIVAQAADGLAAAHAAGLVHRDIKPDNILFEPATGRAKVGDFGLARPAGEGSDLTREGVLAGTPAYLSPEQARGEPDVGPAADVYALGVTLYECLAGEPPFRGTPHRVVRQILADEPRPIRALNDAVPRDLETVCLKAMAKEPDRRYATAADLAADLRRWLGGEPIRARPVGPVGRAWRLCRRHPGVATLAATLALALACGGAGVLWQWRRAEANARQARDYLRRTLSSVDDYFVKVSENRLLDVPGLQPLRRELLEEARRYYEGLLRELPDDPKVRTELARARARLGMVAFAIESQERAIALHREALAEFDRVIREAPGDPAPRRERLDCLARLGLVLTASLRHGEARATYEQLLGESEALLREHPGDARPLEGQYAARHGLALLAGQATGADADAIAGYRRAIEVNRELLEREPDRPDYLANAWRTGVALATSYQNLGRPDDARRAGEEAYRAARRLVDVRPESSAGRLALANAERHLALNLVGESIPLTGAEALAKLDEARGVAGDAVGVLRTLARENPQVDAYRYELIPTLLVAGDVDYLAGRTEEALGAMAEVGRVFAEVSHRGDHNATGKGAAAAALVVTAYTLADAGRAREAVSAVEQAEAFLRRMAPQERAVPYVQNLGLQALFARALLLIEAGRPAEAVEAFDRYTALLAAGRSEHLALARDVLRAWGGLGPPPDPRRIAAALSGVDPRRPPGPLGAIEQVGLARGFALAARADALSDSERESFQANAVYCLEKAGEVGFFRDPRRRASLRDDPVFARLSGRADFGTFLIRVGARRDER